MPRGKLQGKGRREGMGIRLCAMAVTKQQATQDQQRQQRQQQQQPSFSIVPVSSLQLEVVSGVVEASGHDVVKVGGAAVGDAEVGGEGTRALRVEELEGELQQLQRDHSGSSGEGD